MAKLRTCDVCGQIRTNDTMWGSISEGGGVGHDMKIGEKEFECAIYADIDLCLTCLIIQLDMINRDTYGRSMLSGDLCSGT